MGLQTALYAEHLAAGAKLVDFGGWDMPLHYGSQVDEHHAVRTGSGMFDVSHMTVVDVTGADAGKHFWRSSLRTMSANSASPAKPCTAACSTSDGGVVDDLIVYYFSATDYRVVVNAATRDRRTSSGWRTARPVSRLLSTNAPKRP